MEQLILVRDSVTPARTYGSIKDPASGITYQTLEPPPDGNVAGRGSSLAGVYVARLRYSPDHGYAVFGLLAVPNHNNVELHPGNDLLDTEACILLGDRRGLDARGLDAVLDSQAAFLAFMTQRGVIGWRTMQSDEAVAAWIAAHPTLAEFQLAIQELAA
jgi:hypothetical protein